MFIRAMTEKRNEREIVLLKAKAYKITDKRIYIAHLKEIVKQ